MKIFNFLKKKKVIELCTHDWETAEVCQVKIENGILVPFKIQLLELVECKKCKETKRKFENKN